MNLTGIKEKIKYIRFKIHYVSLFVLKTWIRRKIIKLFKFNRPTSYPFITGDGFRALAQHIFDESSDIDYSSVMKGDIIFVRTDFLYEYFRKVHPKIKNQYILISHNCDTNVTEDYAGYIDNKIIHWFAQNLLIKHPKCSAIPIGLILRFYDKKNITVELLKKHREKTSKAPKIFFGFDTVTNKKRIQAFDFLKKSNIGIGVAGRIGQEEYYSRVSDCMFNASPEGNGIDCHRTWESIYLNTIPVVEKSPATEYWEKIGLPMLLIDSWSEVSSFNEENIKRRYEENKHKFDSPAIYMDYWTGEILKYQN